MITETPLPAEPRGRLRHHLLAQRDAWAQGPDFAAAEAALVAHLKPVLRQLEPQCLGLYWPIRGEFNAPLLRQGDLGANQCQWALPFAQRTPLQMHYRAWASDAAADRRDECNIPSVDGPPVVPDVVLVPCVGFTRSGHRLGYGAGYFDRWLGAHPQVTAVGVAWSLSELAASDWQPAAHDQPLMLVVTEHGVAFGG
ncbi:MAG: 5-formyltetrahydrofolate cyclo-ligase [Pseudomonadota bacterium]